MRPIARCYISTITCKISTKKIRNHKYVIGRKVIGGDIIVRDSVAKISE